MTLTYDPEFLKCLEPILPLMAKREPLVVKSVPAERAAREAGFAPFFDLLPDCPDVEQIQYYATTQDGYRLPILGFHKKKSKTATAGASSAEKTPAILHIHGGGMVQGAAKTGARATARIVSDTSVPFFSVDYRLVPEHPGTTLSEDAYTALLWLYSHASELGIDTARIGVHGESAGAGLAVSVALMARDRNLQPPLAKQVLYYPMLDDRTVVEDPVLEPLLAFWTTADNKAAWEAYVGLPFEERNDATVSHYLSPARAKSVKGLPPAYIDVGTLDAFCQEDIAYAARLLAANIPAELHVYPGVSHAFDVVAPHITVSKKAYDNRVRAFTSF